MDPTALFALAYSHAWIPFAAAVVGLLLRLTKDDVRFFPNIPAQYRAALALGLGMVAGVLDAIIAGKPWKVAVGEGLFAAAMAILGHTFGIEGFRGGRELPIPGSKGDAK